MKATNYTDERKSVPKSEVENLQFELEVVDGGEVVHPLIRLG